ncbi:hypothetical protein Tco_0990669 [Tanacetum coccineum]|uniref:Uncharacterized protein n=1 Tax=Tanacetum coccineum TaxID=301880 RepID=A0ABQ5EXE6_9ASTR
MSQPANDEFSQHLSDDEASNHEDASDTGAAPKQQQQVIPQTTAISNIKLPILKKEEYDIWAMEMEHYLEYIDNDVWKVIQNGNSKKRISTGKDGGKGLVALIACWRYGEVGGALLVKEDGGEREGRLWMLSQGSRMALRVLVSSHERFLLEVDVVKCTVVAVVDRDRDAKKEETGRIS